MQTLMLENCMGHLMTLNHSDDSPEVCQVVRECPSCGATQAVGFDMGWKDFLNRLHLWVKRDWLIQDAFCDSTPDQRELLVSGICPRCWNNMD